MGETDELGLTMADFTPYLPGRLGDATMTLEMDRRADPRLVAALTAMGGLAPGVEPIAQDAAYEDCLEYCRQFEEASAIANPELLAALPPFESVETSTQTITGVDGNDVLLYLHRPKDKTGPIPCLIHTHGGGMVMMSAADPGFVLLRQRLAEQGALVVGVEFRNGGGKLGNHPFPAGLNDCASAVNWVHANRTALGIASIVITGESGGGNFSLATTLKANREGWVDQIDGVYAMCPYISGAYANPPPDLLSLYENDGYMLSCEQMATLVTVYDPTHDHAENPLAWPLAATLDDLKGLPRHIISVNELDPLRDEGLAYYRKLLAANVPAVARTVHGTPHAGDQAFPDIVPEVYDETIRSIYGFARDCTSVER